MTAIELHRPSCGTASPYDGKTLTDLVLEMKQMGMDPAPFLALAARDFVRQAGADARADADDLYHHAARQKDRDAMYFWREIYALLSPRPA